METTFPSRSPVGQLYEAIQQKAKAQGMPLAVLEKNIDTGYIEDPFYVPARIEDPGKISAGEVLEYAYRFSEYYSLLHKHGFPVPFAMDDFDPKTEADENIRDQIRFKIRAISWTLIRDRHLVEGSDAYRLALAKEIFDWLASFVKPFQGNKLSQLSASESWQKKEGECTEKSTIFFYAYQEAGLSPRFFLVHNMPPRLEYYFEKSEDNFKDGHVFIGFPLRQGGEWVYVDPALEQFDANYPHAVPLTPRQYAYGVHGLNQFTIAAQQSDQTRLENLSALCEQIAPLSYYCFEKSVMIYVAEHGETGLTEFIRKREALLQHYPSIRKDFGWAIAEMTALKSEELSGRYFEVIFERMESLRHLAASYPYYAAHNYFGLHQRIQTILQALQTQVPHYIEQPLGHRLKYMAKQALFESLKANPYFMSSYWELSEMAIANPSLRWEVFPFLHEIAERNPNHATVHYLAAWIGLHTIKDKAVALTEEEVHQIERHAEILAQLEPDHPATIWMTVIGKFYRGEPEAALQYFESKAQDPKGFPLTFYADLGFIYLITGKQDQARQMYRRLFDFAPKIGPRLLCDAIQNQILPRFVERTGEDEKESHRGLVEFEKLQRPQEVWEFYGELMEWLSSVPEMKERLEKLYGRLLFAFLYFGQEKEVRTYQQKIGGKATPSVQQGFHDILGDFLRELKEVQALPKQKLAKCARFLPKLKPWLGEASRELWGETHVELARFYLADQQFAKARELFQQAYQLNPQILSERVYGQRLIQEFFTRLDKNPQDPKSLQQAWQVLELGYPYRAKFSEPLREMVRAGYAMLHDSYQQLKKRPQALLANQKSQGLR